ncbi:TetR/AcrR family transcriptional regulator [Jiangella asiatica]|uniref:TetR family transcriptional regulator n=1 Tax=Jiangella asiatica TaxID=2530372 RepID=A0A4R5D8P5_9ACTN|nr:TetR family transcriptional regulator C-terminal domain-containing protein [Jiangella asiatica]TDE08270.1 TetR family transcriptional regulator [Jiangella asiatica]
MPRTADHDARRRQIAAAVVGVVAADGFDAATVARVAAEAGVSVGLVQHYFASKDELLLFAYQQVTGDIGDRVAQLIADGDARRQPISVVVAASLAELLPLDERRRGEYRVARAFLGRALDNPSLASVARATAADLRGRLSAAVTNGKECGEVAPGVDAELAATRLAALVDGLGDQLYLEPQRRVGSRDLPAVARRTLGEALAETFTGECRHYR